MINGRKSYSSDDEAAVRAVEAAYDVAWNAGDVGDVLRLHTDRVVITNPSGDTTVGLDEAAKSLVALMEGVARGSKHASEVVAVRFVTPDVALVDGVAIVSGFGERSEPLRHNYTDLLVRTADGWRIDQVRAYVFTEPPTNWSAARHGGSNQRIEPTRQRLAHNGSADACSSSVHR